MPDFGLKFKAVLHAGKVKGIPRMQQEWFFFFLSLYLKLENGYWRKIGQDQYVLQVGLDKWFIRVIFWTS